MIPLNPTDVFRPQHVGDIALKGYSARVLGYALDQEVFVALAFANTATACDAIRGAFMDGREISFFHQRRLAGHREKGRELYETLPGALPGTGGFVHLLLHRAALSAYLTEPPDAHRGRFDHFYAFAPGTGKPPFPLWVHQLQALVNLPTLPGWETALWSAAVSNGLAVALTEVAGFGGLWRVSGDRVAWRGFYARLGLEAKLQVPPDAVIEAARP